MAIAIRLGVVACASDPGGIGVWIDTSKPGAVHMRFRTDPSQPWQQLV